MHLFLSLGRTAEKRVLAIIASGSRGPRLLRALSRLRDVSEYGAAKKAALITVGTLLLSTTVGSTLFGVQEAETNAAKIQGKAARTG